LLQVDERRHLVAVFRLQVELIDHGIAEKDLADVPDHAFLHMRVPTPRRSQTSSERLEKQIAREPSPILSSSSSSTTGWPRCARSIASDRPTVRADDDHRMLGNVRAGPVLIGMAPIAKSGGVLLSHPLAMLRIAE